MKHMKCKLYKHGGRGFRKHGPIGCDSFGPGPDFGCGRDESEDRCKRHHGRHGPHEHHGMNHCRKFKRHGPHGHGPHGHGPHGHGPHGHGPHGHGPHGHGPRGHGPHGHGPHKHGPLEHGPHKHAPLEHGPCHEPSSHHEPGPHHGRQFYRGHHGCHGEHGPPHGKHGKHGHGCDGPHHGQDRRRFKDWSREELVLVLLDTIERVMPKTNEAGPCVDANQTSDQDQDTSQCENTEKEKQVQETSDSERPQSE